MPKNDLTTLILTLQLVVFTGQLVGLFLAIRIYRRQADEASKSRKLEATRLLIELIGSDEVREIRTWFLEQFQASPNGIEDKETERKIRRLIVAYDRVGLMITQDLLLGPALIGFQGEEIERIWEKASPFIDQIRKQRGNYANNFQALALTWLPQARLEGRFQKS
jgi:hypothetical protein